jgi:uncharacterized protein (TIGR02231 family)
MRTLIPCLIAIAGVAGESVTATSRISAATVYLDRAWVEREATVTLPAGSSRVAIAGLPVELDDGSLRLAVVAGQATVASLAVEAVVVERQPGDALAAVERDLAAVTAAKNAAADRAATLESAVALVGSLQAASVPKAEPMAVHVLPPTRPGPRDFTALVTWSIDERMRLGERLREAKAALAEAEQKRATLAARRDLLTHGERSESRTVAIDLDLPAAAKVTLRLTYLLPGACWYPSYDARVDLDTGKLVLEQEAMVQQATGEDWRDCRLTLCFARPTQVQQAPSVAPWIIAAAPPPGRPKTGDETQREIFNSSFDMQYATNGSDYNAGDNLKVQMRNRAGDKTAMGNLVKSSVVLNDICRVLSERPVTATYAPSGPVTIASDGRTHRVRLARVALPVALTRLAATAVAPDVSVIGRLANAGTAPWLPGTIHLFHGNDLIGRTGMPFTAPGEGADLWLGTDALVTVTRTADGARREDSTWGGRRRVIGGWTIAVANRRTVAVAVDVVEALPVAEGEAVTVRLGDPTPKPTTVERGVHRWRLDVVPGSTGTVHWSATVEHPIGSEPSGLAALGPIR